MYALKTSKANMQVQSINITQLSPDRSNPVPALHILCCNIFPNLRQNSYNIRSPTQRKTYYICTYWITTAKNIVSIYSSHVSFINLQEVGQFLELERIFHPVIERCINTSWSPPCPPCGGIFPGWSGGWTRTASKFWPWGCRISVTSRQCLLNIPFGNSLLCPFRYTSAE